MIQIKYCHDVPVHCLIDKDEGVSVCTSTSVCQCDRDVVAISICACLCVFLTFHTQEKTIQYNMIVKEEQFVFDILLICVLEHKF